MLFLSFLQFVDSLFIFGHRFMGITLKMLVQRLNDLHMKQLLKEPHKLLEFDPFHNAFLFV